MGASAACGRIGSGRSVLGVVAAAVVLTGCYGGAASPTPGGASEVLEQLTRNGLQISSAVAGDAGCDDASLADNATHLLVSLPPDRTPHDLYLYTFKSASFAAEAGLVDACQSALAARSGVPAERIDLAPFRVAVTGSTPALRDAVMRSLAAAARGGVIDRAAPVAWHAPDMPQAPRTAPRITRRSAFATMLLALAMAAPTSTIALSVGAPATVAQERIDDPRPVPTTAVPPSSEHPGALRREMAEWFALRAALADATASLAERDQRSAAGPAEPPMPTVKPPWNSAPATRPAPKPAPRPAARPKPRPTPVSDSGHDRFWYPGLGIARPVSSFACDRVTPPGTPVCRWGCAGANNVYLLAHAYIWFKPLNVAYYAHRLHKGQLAVYADHAGRAHFYRLDYWKVGPPTEGQHWAWDPHVHSVLTLQTCVGSHSESRLFVRFHEVARP